MSGLLINALVSSCISCHGGGEARLPQPYDGIPVIEGQNRTYLIKQLTDFKEKNRKHDAMNEVAKDLTTKQINKLADYFSGQGKVVPVLPNPPKVDMKKEED